MYSLNTTIVIFCWANSTINSIWLKIYIFRYYTTSVSLSIKQTNKYVEKYFDSSILNRNVSCACHKFTFNLDEIYCSACFWLINVRFIRLVIEWFPEFLLVFPLPSDLPGDILLPPFALAPVPLLLLPLMLTVKLERLLTR